MIPNSFWNDVRTYQSQGQRAGQALYNVLHQSRPDLANRLRELNIDPFYVTENDPKYTQAITFLTENW